MLLRWLVTSYLKQAAQQKLMDAVTQAAQGGKPRRTPDDNAAPDDEGAHSPPIPCEIVFVFALGIESGGLVDLLTDSVTSRCPSFLEHAGDFNGRRVAVIDAGVGREAAARATADAIALHRPAWVVSTGFAGALVDEVKRGHFVFADSVADTLGNQIGLDLHLSPPAGEVKPNWHVGKIVTVDRIIRQEAEKRELAAQHGAIACDLETAAVARVCERMQTRFLAVRIISDAVDDKLPKEVERLMGKKSLAFKLGAAIGAVLDRPSSVKDMWQLREDALRASDRLARFLAGVAEQLPGDLKPEI